MSEGILAAVPEDVYQSLLIDGSDVQTKLDHVAKFDSDEKRNDLDEFIGLTKEVLG